MVAETSFEMTAYDRDGKLIMRPQVANREASYKERYLLWAGPFVTQEKVQKGQGLLVDFSDVGLTVEPHTTTGKDKDKDGNKGGKDTPHHPRPANYNPTVEINHPFGKN